MPSLFKNIIAACGLALAVSAPAAALDLHGQIDPLAQPLIEDEVAVGIVIGVVRKGETQILAYGETVKGGDTAPDGDTIYEIGSTTKVFTAALLAEMAQAGLVKLDDPLAKFLPDEAPASPDENTPITLEHLATHTSGLPRLPGNLRPADPANPYADYSTEQLFGFLEKHKLQRPPGTYEYSNLGMGLLGQVLARHRETTYDDLLVKRVCQPLGLGDTRITLSEEQQKRLAPPYDAGFSPAKNWDLPTLAGAGAVRSSCRDMLMFLEANLAEDEAPLTGALRLTQEKRHTMENGSAIGLGWHITPDGAVLEHNGMTGGYHSYLALVPDRKIGVVVLSNTATMKITELGGLVRRVACGEEVKPLPRRKTVAIDPETLKSYAGFYAITPQFGLAVTAEGGTLWVEPTGQPKLQVFPESQTKFFFRVVEAEIAFQPDDDGKVNRLILRQSGRELEATRRE